MLIEWVPGNQIGDWKNFSEVLIKLMQFVRKGRPDTWNTGQKSKTAKILWGMTSEELEYYIKQCKAHTKWCIDDGGWFIEGEKLT